MATNTSLMGLPVPQINDPSPGYVTNIAQALALLDAHDHSTGKGTPVTPGGINLNAALPFNANSATNLRSTQFANLGTALSSIADNTSLYVYNGDLWYLNGSNQAVRLTAGAVTSVSTAGFFGDYAAYLATASYAHPTKQYSFFDDQGAAATLNVLGINASGTLSANGLTAQTGTFASGFSAAAATITNNVTAGSVSSPVGSFSTSVTGGSGSFSTLAASGNLTAPTATFSTSVTGGSGSFSTLAASGNLTAPTATFSTSVNGNAGTFTSVNASQGVQSGSRFLACRAFISSTALASGTSNPLQMYAPGSTPAFVQAAIQVPYACSIAAITMRYYGNAPTSGTAALTINTVAVGGTGGYTAIGGASGYNQTFTMGSQAYAANTILNLALTYGSWAQTGTTSGVEVAVWLWC